MQTNYFTPLKVTNGLKDYEPIRYVIFSSRGNYTFPRFGNLSNAEVLSVGYFPTTESLKGVILYYYSTLFGDRQLPTNQGYLIQALTALYTSHGYAILFPNYLKQHPYLLYPQQNAQSGVLALNEFKKILDTKYPIMGGRYNLFTVGYS